MSKKKAPPRFSEEISSFCKTVENAQKEYAWLCEEITRLEKLQQDYLHLIEFGGLKYDERAKVATSLKKCRVERRQCKNRAEVLYPLCAFFTNDRWKNLEPALQEVLGNTRKVEKAQRSRVYVPRVLTDQDVIK